MSAFKAYSCLMAIDCSVIGKHSLSESVDKIKESLRSIFTFDNEVKVPTNVGEMHVLVSAKNGGNASLTTTINVYESPNFITINMESSDPLVPVSSTDCDERNGFQNVEAITISNSITEKLRDKISETLEVEVEKIPVIKRGSAVPNYFTSSDERVLEYDFDRLVFDKRSKYQQIRIFHSNTLGNALFLDGLQNIADADISYTHSLMKFGVNSYADKEILILGGGDGGLLHELLKEKPKYVLMVDIDQMVVDACRVHLRAVCGDVLDTLKGDNYEVIIGDCIQYLEQFAEQGKQFDFIFNDLTDIPISPTNSVVDKNLWDFIRNTLNLSFKCLKADGKFLNHAIGAGSINALQSYEKLLSELPVKVKFSRHSAYIPSFAEEWVFYEICRIAESS